MRAALRRLQDDWVELDGAERDPGFRDLVADLTGRGMRAAGLAGLIALSLYLLSYVLSGRELSFDWADKTRIVLWDKLLIAAVMSAFLWLAGRPGGRRFGRELVAVAAVLVCLASVLDDRMNRDVTFSSAWFVLSLFVAAGAVPLKPRQIALLCAVLFGTLVIPVATAPEAVSGGSLRTQAVFFAAVSVFVFAISVSLYRARYRLYQADRRNRQLAEENAAKADRIEQVEALKSRFFAGITHDLRTPLSLIKGPLDDTLGPHLEELPPTLRAPLEIARRNAAHLGDLADDLLDLGHIDSGKLVLRRAPYDLADACARYVVDLQPLAERHGVTLSFAARGPRTTCEFDPDRMQQVVANLVSNAVRYTPPGGTVTVSVGPGDAGRLRLDVRDDGPGIPEGIRDTLFERFTQGREGHARTGFGLGLAIAREFVVLHGGTIEVAETGPEGTVFRVELPAASAEPLPIPDRHRLRVPAALPAAREDAAPDPGGEDPGSALPFIVVADDNPDMRAYLRLHLEGRYRIAEAASGEQALALVRAERPDLVLSDVVMPGMDGIELCRSIRSDPERHTVPIVLLTAGGDAATRVRGLAAGADDFLQKPFDAEALLARLENLVELRKLLSTGAPYGSIAVAPTQVHVTSTAARFVEQVKAIVEAHLADSNFGVEWLADEVAISPRQLQRRLRDATRLSAAGFIRWMRLGRAAQLLASGARNVSEAAYDVGFHDADHFAQLFKQAYGVSPSEYARGTRA